MYLSSYGEITRKRNKESPANIKKLKIAWGLDDNTKGRKGKTSKSLLPEPTVMDGHGICPTLLQQGDIEDGVEVVGPFQQLLGDREDLEDTHSGASNNPRVGLQQRVEVGVTASKPAGDAPDSAPQHRVNVRSSIQDLVIGRHGVSSGGNSKGGELQPIVAMVNNPASIPASCDIAAPAVAVGKAMGMHALAGDHVQGGTSHNSQQQLKPQQPQHLLEQQLQLQLQLQQHQQQ